MGSLTCKSRGIKGAARSGAERAGQRRGHGAGQGPPAAGRGLRGAPLRPEDKEAAGGEEAPGAYQREPAGAAAAAGRQRVSGEAGERGGAGADGAAGAGRAGAPRPRGRAAAPRGQRALRRRLHPVHARGAHLRLQLPWHRRHHGRRAAQPPAGVHAPQRGRLPGLDHGRFGRARPRPLARRRGAGPAGRSPPGPGSARPGALALPQRRDLLRLGRGGGRAGPDLHGRTGRVPDAGPALARLAQIHVETVVTEERSEGRPTCGESRALPLRPQPRVCCERAVCASVCGWQRWDWALHRGHSDAVTP